MWANCPHQWKLRYVDGHKDDTPGIELVFGTAMHDTIQHWLTILYNDTPVKARTFDMHEFLKARLIELVREELIVDGVQLTTQKEVAEYYAEGCNILDHVRKHANDWFPKSHQLIGVEVPLDVEVAPGVRFKAFLDIVLYHKSMKTVYIYDFKTSRRGWFWQKKDPKKTDQLLLYKKYYSKIFGIPMDNIKVEFIILKRQVTEHKDFAVKHVVGFEPSHGTISMKRASERFDTFLSLFDEQGNPDTSKLHATPSEMACKYCPFKNNVDLCEYSAYLPTSQRKLPIKGK